MAPGLPLVVAALAAPAADFPTDFRQVAPDRRGEDWSAAPRTRDRAVLVIPGLRIYPLRPARCERPEFRNYHDPAGELVRTLAKDSDVFAFAYAQTAAVDEVARSAGLRAAVADLNKSGYKEIVLLGHSAGGVVARLFAERYPDSGVTKVVCVAAPHSGAGLAGLKVGYPKAQAPLVRSLTAEARARARPQKLPDHIAMACVVCKLGLVDADGLVTVATQWPEECRGHGVPAALVVVNHWEAMLDAGSVKVIAELVRGELARWSPEEVGRARKVLFGDDRDK